MNQELIQQKKSISTQENIYKPIKWLLKHQPERLDVEMLSKSLNVSFLVASLLLQRDIKTFEEAKTFFRPQLSDLHDPFLMKDMKKAVARIEDALIKNEKILVYGDYDVDGTSSVALMSSYLKTRHKNIGTYIPDRYTEGYGISFKGIDFAYHHNFSLIIALDCGIKAIDKVIYAKEKKIDFIICDHHKPGSQVPEAVAVLNPKQQDCLYPYKELCGCGVGFKLIQALAYKNGKTIHDLLEYLDLVAIAIGADIVPITEENRVLAYFGLQVINKTPRAGFKAMINQAKKTYLTITDVVFIIGPRINAAGRMKHGQYAVNLLTETDVENSEAIAKEIEIFNTDRKNTDRQITQEALFQIINNKEQHRFTNVVYDENWHKGVIGIVASRLIETYYKPTLVFTKSGDRLAASARSVSGFDIYEAIASCSEYIDQFGGHKYAAGLTLKEENYEAFKAKFEDIVANTIKEEQLRPELHIDQEIELKEVNNKLMRILKQFAPFGPGNRTPVFMTKSLKDTGYGKCVGNDKNHLRITATQQGVKKLTGIGFGLGNKFNLVANQKRFSAVYSIDENEWQGKISLQLKLKDLKDG